MEIKEHTRNQKRMYRIHKQEEKIQSLELLVGKLQQENEQLKKQYEKVLNDFCRLDVYKRTIDKAIDRINDYKIYCKENKGFTEYTDIEIEAIEPILTKIEDILKAVR